MRLLLLSGVAAFALAGCGEEDPLKTSQLFKNELECSAVRPADECKQAFASAKAEHMRTAPAFASREACEQKFGASNCQPGEGQAPAQVAQQQSQGGGGFFVPMMIGYMMGNMLGGSQAALAGNQTSATNQAPAQGKAGATTASGAGAANTAKPVYRDTNNRVYSGGKAFSNFNTNILGPAPRPVAALPAGGTMTQRAQVPATTAQPSTAPSGPVQRGGFGSSRTSAAS